MKRWSGARADGGLCPPSAIKIIPREIIPREIIPWEKYPENVFGVLINSMEQAIIYLFQSKACIAYWTL